MKNLKFVVFTLVLLGLLAGCELAPTFTDLYGDWEFPDGTTVYFMEGTPPDGLGLDIGWLSESADYWFFGEGDLVGTKWSGTHGYNASTIVDEGEESVSFSDEELTLSIRITVKNNKLSMSFSGEGPLKGKKFSGGVKQPNSPD